MHEHAQQAKMLHKFLKNFKSQEFIKILIYYELQLDHKVFSFNPSLIAISHRCFFVIFFLFQSFLLLCRHSRNSWAYHAPRKDVIDYTHRSRWDITLKY